MEKIPFCRPDVGEAEIAEVVAVLKSGWITTGPKTAEFEQQLASYLDVDRVVCFGSATAAMELLLRFWGVGPGDEVITTPYTYAATVNAIIHTGAVPVLADVSPESFSIDPVAVQQAISSRTKVVLPVDFAGWPCAYQELGQVVAQAVDCFSPRNQQQERMGRILLLGDCAHSLGSEYEGKKMAEQLDVAAYSFHAVKNLTTAEGGCLAFRYQEGLFSETTAKELRYYGLHGQSKDALDKYRKGGWEYDILFPGYKCNMTDLQAAIGLAQLRGYAKQLDRREQIFSFYNKAFSSDERFIIPPFEGKMHKGSSHIYPLRFRGFSEQQRNCFIEKMAGLGVQCNVHFKPIPLFTAFREMFDIVAYPNAMRMYQNEVTLPLYPSLTDEEVEQVIQAVFTAVTL